MRKIFIIFALIIFVCAAERLRINSNKSKTSLYFWPQSNTNCVYPCQKAGGNCCVKSTTTLGFKNYHCCKGYCAISCVEIPVSC